MTRHNRVYPPRLYGNMEERALARLEFSDGCWEWSGYRNKDGYGILRIDGRRMFVHRAMVEWALKRRLHRLEIVDHLCRNKPCARPTHLEVVTPSENTRRGWAARLSTENADKLKDRRRDGLTYMALAKEFGIHYTTAIRICKSRTLTMMDINEIGDEDATGQGRMFE